MLSQHLPNHLKFPTHCAKSGGRVPPKLNCGLFHTFGCDIELSLRTMPLVQYLRVVIYISSIRSVHSKHLLLHHNILCGIELSLTGRGHCTHFCTLWLMAWKRLVCYEIVPLTEYIIAVYVWYSPNVCDTIPKWMYVILSHMWHSPVVLGLAPGSALSAIVSDHNRRIIHNLCLFVVSNGAIWGLLFVLLFQNRAWLVVDHQNVQMDKRCQFATHASQLTAPLHYCSYTSEDNC